MHDGTTSTENTCYSFIYNTYFYELLDKQFHFVIYHWYLHLQSVVKSIYFMLRFTNNCFNATNRMLALPELKSLLLFMLLFLHISDIFGLFFYLICSLCSEAKKAIFSSVIEKRCSSVSFCHCKIHLLLFQILKFFILSKNSDICHVYVRQRPELSENCSVGIPRKKI